MSDKERNVNTYKLGIPIIVSSDLLDSDGSGHRFDVDQPLDVTTPTLYLTLDDPTVKYLEITDVLFRLEAANDVTFQLYLLSDAQDTALTRRSNVVYDSGEGKLRNVDYHETPHGRVPTVVKLATAGRLYYMVDLSAAAGVTPGYLVIRGRRLRG